MRAHIFIFCLAVFTLCALAQSQNGKGPDKCCFAFSNTRIPVNQVEGYQTTHLECRFRGIIFTTKGSDTRPSRDICADLNERWVQRLKEKVDIRALREINSSSGDSP